jgi:hypothetical protein
MRRSSLSIASVLTAAAIVVSCTDRPPTAPMRLLSKSADYTAPLGCDATYTSLVNLVNAVFGAGSPNANSALGKLSNMQKQLDKGDMVDAVAQAKNLISFIQQKASTLPGASQAQTLIDQLECYVGIAANTFLIFPSDQPQTIINSTGQAGLSLPVNPVSEPTLVTITTLGTSQLVTQLDVYPGFVEITQQSGVTNSFIKQVTVAVCPAPGIDPVISARLRLGHQSSVNGFQITPFAPADFLSCSGNISIGSAKGRLPGWIRSLASMVLPKPLYAKMRFAGGVGGLASEFSPFGPVDPVLSATGGVGGLASEFLRAPVTADTAAASGTRKPTGLKPRMSLSPPTSGIARRADAVVVSCTAEVDAALPVNCRPRVTVKTQLGTVIVGATVNWNAHNNSQAASDGGAPLGYACGTFGTTASSTTNANGIAGACWTLGPVAGQDSLIATPAPGALPPGVTFLPAADTFTVTAAKKMATITLGGLTQTYTGDPRIVTASTAPQAGLSVVIKYNNSTTAPSAAGSYSIQATVDDPSWQGSTNGTLSVGQSEPVVIVTCPATAVYTGSPLTPCSATATAPGLSTTPTPDYTLNTDVGTATATVTLAAGGNYAAASGSATFAITAAPTTTTVTCSPLSLMYTGSPLTPCSATVTGPGSLSLTPPPTYTSNTNVGTATASVSYAGGSNYLPSSDSKNFAITEATTVTTVSCSPDSFMYTGSPLTPCTATVTGPGLSLTPIPTYTANTNVGTATATVNYAGGGNYLSSNDSKNFTITPATTIASVSCPASVPYTGSPLTPCSATVTGPGLSLTPTPTYASNTNAGPATATVNYAGGGNYLPSADTKSFQITQHAATATAGNATINFGAAVPTIPCTVTGLLALDAGTVTCTTTVDPFTIAGTYPAKPIVSTVSPVNYSVTKVDGLLTVAGYVQVGCFSSPIYNVMPTTKSAQRKGSNLPVKCTLTTPQGTPVTNAKGSLVVEDRGTTGTATATTAFTSNGANVFSVSSSGNYSYGLDTSPATFVAGHYYYVIATWSDGSTSVGWFLLK